MPRSRLKQAPSQEPSELEIDTIWSAAVEVQVETNRCFAQSDSAEIVPQMIHDDPLAPPGDPKLARYVESDVQRSLDLP